MAIIVEHLGTGREYILLGAGFGANASNLPSRFLKNWLPDQVAVCDRNGKILGLPAAEVIVVEIDGQKPTELLPEAEPPLPEPLDIPPLDPPPYKFKNDPLEVLKEEDPEDDGDWL